ncbi:hypothetical protein P879_11110 [Paragonimus westermani]|uniref:NADH dehydrogenase [ubiquinone] iron-sulfur protein 4, mitochondrial n=1 Tax=Paragonimus westermani TaxID=34504 RepID=A0A8T0DA07_9TREM|nr:hypothetical protein P879_11110 [Paragonimus westermani]
MRKSDQFSEEDRVIVPDKVDLTKLNGVPEEHQSGRRVRIYLPARSVMQSGTNGCRLWQLEFDNRERWENPLMGWASSGDPLSCTTVEFETSEAAVEFCQRQGWPCYVDTPNFPKMTLRSMPICVDRERRPNAGARMAKLLNEEEEDEFYTNVYGGFTEEANDADYESESSVEDIIDSDFESDPSAAESEEAASDEDNEKRRKRCGHSGVVTKAYKEPKRSKKEEDRSKPIQVDDPSESQAKSTPRSKEVPRTSSSEVISESRTLRPRAQPIATAENKISGDRRSIRTGDANATALRREAILAEIAQRKNVPEVRRLTQEELLAEAKLTEELNRRSLGQFFSRLSHLCLSRIGHNHDSYDEGISTLMCANNHRKCG